MGFGGDPMNEPIEVEASFDRPLRLDAFLKICGVAPTGGIAKLMIQDGIVSVNGRVETRRGRNLVPGDVVSVDDEESFVVVET